MNRDRTHDEPSAVTGVLLAAIATLLAIALMTVAARKQPIERTGVPAEGLPILEVTQ